MLAEIQQLLVLQDRDQKIRKLQQEFKTVPLERKTLGAKLESLSAGLDTFKARAREIELEKKKLEMEAKTKRDSIAKFKTQQFQTRKNEEFQALGNEIKRYESDIVKLEDRELELMEEAERVKTAVGGAEKEFGQAKSQIDRQLGDLEAKAKAIEAQLRELETERAKLAGGIEEDLLDTYERLFASKHGLAIAPIEHEVCMGCHMKVTTQTAVRVKGQREIVSCEQCGRILYPVE